MNRNLNWEKHKTIKVESNPTIARYFNKIILLVVNTARILFTLRAYREFAFAPE